MLYIGVSWFFLAATLLICIIGNHPKLRNGNELSRRQNRIVCLGLFAAGCICRLLLLGTLPGGLNAEEALTGAQAKALWQLGGFYPDGRWTTQLSYWEGESTGPLLAVLTAPFVGLFGTGVWPVRLPLVLLSIAAMPAMYGIGRRLRDERTGRCALLICALCPCYVLNARLTAGANAALYLLPIAVYFLLAGEERPGFFYPGMILLALLAYAQDMYFFLAPLLLVIAMLFSFRRAPVHVLLSGALGIFLVIPAVLTAVVNMTGGDSTTFLGVITIPVLENFDKAEWLGVRMQTSGDPANTVLNQFWAAVLSGGVFGRVIHENIDRSLFAPQSFSTFYPLSLPLILLGMITLIHGLGLRVRRYKTGGQWPAYDRRTESGKQTGDEETIRTKAELNQRHMRWMMVWFAVAAAVCIMLFGCAGQTVLYGKSSCYDYACLFLYVALLMAAGLSRLGRKHRAAAAASSGMIVISFCLLCVFLFGGEYEEANNISFFGFREAAQEAEQVHQETGARVNVTGEMYPHLDPGSAAEMMYLTAGNADMRNTDYFEIVYPPALDGPETGEVYLVRAEDTAYWDIDAFDYREYGEFVLLVPLE